MIHATLARQHGFTGHYSSVCRLIAQIGRDRAPEVTVRLTFAPGEAAQVDFGAGPQLVDPATGEVRRTWTFVMTLCFSRHQYVEFIWDQSVRTWLGCHRRAFEWFGAVPARLIIDNAQSERESSRIRLPKVCCRISHRFLLPLQAPIQSSTRHTSLIIAGRQLRAAPAAGDSGG